MRSKLFHLKSLKNMFPNCHWRWQLFLSIDFFAGEWWWDKTCRDSCAMRDRASRTLGVLLSGRRTIWSNSGARETCGHSPEIIIVGLWMQVWSQKFNYKAEVMKSCQLFEYASMWHLQAVEAVVRRKIRSVYPETTPEVGQRSMFYLLKWSFNT